MACVAVTHSTVVRRDEAETGAARLVQLACEPVGELWSTRPVSCTSNWIPNGCNGCDLTLVWGWLLLNTLPVCSHL